jgi:hypothetical protein
VEGGGIEAAVADEEVKPTEAVDFFDVNDGGGGGGSGCGVVGHGISVSVPGRMSNGMYKGCGRRTTSAGQ